MNKTDQVIKAIINLRSGGTVEMTFAEHHWFLLVVERYKLDFDINVEMKISGDNIVLTGVKND
jgi:hypothetical protein